MACLEEFGIEGFLPFDCETLFLTPANDFPARAAAPLGNKTAALSASTWRSFWDPKDAAFGNWVETVPFAPDASIQWK